MNHIQLNRQLSICNRRCWRRCISDNWQLDNWTTVATTGDNWTTGDNGDAATSRSGYAHQCPCPVDESVPSELPCRRLLLAFSAMPTVCKRRQSAQLLESGARGKSRTARGVILLIFHLRASSAPFTLHCTTQKLGEAPCRAVHGVVQCVRT